jgi:signal transduction histidine kinase
MSAAALGVVAAPLCAAAFMTGSVLGFQAWETGIGDAALIGYGAAALLLGLRWRFVGDAVCIPLAAAAAVVGFALVPPTIHEGQNPSPIVGLRLAAGIVLVVVALRALASEEVRSDLRPVRYITLTFVITGAFALLLSLWPFDVIVEHTPIATRMLSAGEATAQLVVAMVFLLAGVRRQRRLFVAVGIMVVAVAVSGVLRVVHPHGLWLDLAALFLLAAAVELVVTIAGELQSAISAVVHHDVRGTRRWEAAEAELHEIRLSIQGRHHDVRNVLNAVDGTLLVLTSHRQSMPDEEIDKVIGAIRQEVQWLQLVVGDGSDARSYDLSALVRAIVDVRSTSDDGFDILAEIEPGLTIEGRPDRVAIAIDNLLVNVGVHAPGANAVVTARRAGGPGEMVEVIVADNGPGLLDSELSVACHRGWRAMTAADRPGSGLGLAQVHELITSEGGAIVLQTAPPPTGGTLRRGLTVQLRLPARQDGHTT